MFLARDSLNKTCKLIKETVSVPCDAYRDIFQFDKSCYLIQPEFVTLVHQRKKKQIPLRPISIEEKVREIK